MREWGARMTELGAEAGVGGGAGGRSVGWGVVRGVGDRGVRRLVVVCGVPPPT